MGLKNRPKRRLVDWAAHTETLLKMRREQNASPQRIADAIGCSRSAVEDQITKLRGNGVDVPLLAPPVWTEERNRQLLALDSEGMTDRQIADVLGLSRQAVATKRWELRKVGNNPSPVLSAFIKRRADAGVWPLPPMHPIAAEVLGMHV